MSPLSFGAEMPESVENLPPHSWVPPETVRETPVLRTPASRSSIEHNPVISETFEEDEVPETQRVPQSPAQNQLTHGRESAPDTAPTESGTRVRNGRIEVVGKGGTPVSQQEPVARSQERFTETEEQESAPMTQRSPGSSGAAAA